MGAVKRETVDDQCHHIKYLAALTKLTARTVNRKQASGNTELGTVEPLYQE